MGLTKWIKALEPLWWSLFGLGGAVAAFFLPAHVFIQGVAIPSGWVSQDMLYYDRVIALLSSPIVKVYIFFLIMLPLFHAAHRIRLTLEDMRMEWMNSILPLLCYGGATALTVVTLVVILRLP